MIRAALVAAIFVSASAVLADDPKPVAQKADLPAETVAPSTPVDAAVAFMNGLTHCSRPGADGAKAWQEIAANSDDKVSVKVAGKDVALDAAAKKFDAKVVKFARGHRDGSKVTFDSVQMKVGAEDHTGKGTLSLEQKDGKWLVQTLEID